MGLNLVSESVLTLSIELLGLHYHSLLEYLLDLVVNHARMPISLDCRIWVAINFPD